MVEIFKTNINTAAQAHSVEAALKNFFPDYRINVDLQDCDRVLRIEHSTVELKKIIQIVKGLHFEIEVLTDTPFSST